jgi:hypothetical protein
MLKEVQFKFPGTFKVRSFIVYPFLQGQEEILIQSNDAIARISLTPLPNGNYRGNYAVHAGGAFAMHLSAMNPKRKPSEFPAEFIKQCLEAQPKSGDSIGPGISIL